MKRGEERCQRPLLVLVAAAFIGVFQATPGGLETLRWAGLESKFCGAGEHSGAFGADGGAVAVAGVHDRVIG